MSSYSFLLVKMKRQTAKKLSLKQQKKKSISSYEWKCEFVRLARIFIWWNQDRKTWDKVTRLYAYFSGLELVLYTTYHWEAIWCGGEDHRFWSRNAWVQIPALPFASCSCLRSTSLQFLLGTSISFFYHCCNKLLQNWWLEMTYIFYSSGGQKFKMGLTGLKSRISRVALSRGGSKGSYFLASSTL